MTGTPVRLDLSSPSRGPRGKPPKHFDALVWRGLGLDRHPDLRDTYFGNYRRVVLLSQAADEDLIARARDAAARLGLAFEHRPVGRDGLADPVLAFVERHQAHHAAAR